MTKTKEPVTLETMKTNIKFMLDAYDKGYMTWRKIKKELAEMIADESIAESEVVTDGGNAEGVSDADTALESAGG